MTGPTASLNALAYRRALSTVGTTSGEPPGTPCGPRTISPTALPAGSAASTASAHRNLPRLLLCSDIAAPLYTGRSTLTRTVHASGYDVNLSVSFCAGAAATCAAVRHQASPK